MKHRTVEQNPGLIKNPRRLETFYGACTVIHSSVLYGSQLLFRIVGGFSVSVCVLEVVVRVSEL